MIDFPSSRADLYQDGVDVLLKKWDAKRNIERQQLYKRLSLKRKEDLLSYVAYKTFSTGNYFFKQREAAKLISQYIENLPGASTDPEALDLDSVAVLKSIEAQHGLFVERARGIYSFSHLTFHEYFTARKIEASCNPNSADDPTLKELVKHVTEPRWKEVFLLVTEMLGSTDVFLQLMKQEIDSLLAKDEKLQQFLRWVKQKSLMTESSSNLVKVRAFYFTFSNSFRLDYNLDPDFVHTRTSNRALDTNLISACSLLNLLASDYSCNNVYARALLLDFERAIKRAVEVNNFNLKSQLENLRQELPDPLGDIIIQINWYKKYGHDLKERLRSILIEHRNIGHDWQFSEEQKQLLEQYYDANKLLVTCLNLPDIFVNPKVRQEIEEMLLLPWEEVELCSGI